MNILINGRLFDFLTLTPFLRSYGDLENDGWKADYWRGEVGKEWELGEFGDRDIELLCEENKVHVNFV